MAYFESWFKVDLALPLQKRVIETELVNADKQGNLIGVELYKNNVAVEPSGTVAGYALLSDGTTASFSGAISTNKIYVILPEAAYAVVGPVTILIRLTENSKKTTVLVAQGHIRDSYTTQQNNNPNPNFDPSDEPISELYSRVTDLEHSQSQTNIITNGLDNRTGNLETDVSDLNQVTGELGVAVTGISSNLLNNYLTTSQTSEAVNQRIDQVRIGSRNYLQNSSANVIIRDAEPNTDYPPSHMAFDLDESGYLYYEEDINTNFAFELDGTDLIQTDEPDGYDYMLEIDDTTGCLYFTGDPEDTYYVEDDRFFNHWTHDAASEVAVHGKHNGQNAIQFTANPESGDICTLVNNSLYDTINVESGDDITISLWYNLTNTQKQAWIDADVNTSFQFKLTVQSNAASGTELIQTVNRYSQVGWRKVTKTFKMGTDFQGYMPDSNFYFAVIADGAGSIQFGQVMIEKSNKASDWAPAPEDGDEVDNNNWIETKQIASGVLTEVTRVNSDLTTNYSTTIQTADMISAAVTTLENDIATNYSTRTQTADAIEDAVTSINSDLTANYSTHAQTADAISDMVTAIDTDLTNHYSTKAQTADAISTAVVNINNNLQTNYSTITQTSQAIATAVTSINNDLSSNYSTITQTSNAIAFSVGTVANTLQNGSRNLIRNTSFPTVSDTKYYPNINGYQNGRFFSVAGMTLAAADHGIKQTSTGANNVQAYFGVTTIANAGMYGLVPGKTYTMSFITDFKMFSGSPASSDVLYYQVKMFYVTSLSASSWSSGEAVNIQQYDSTNFGTQYLNKQVVLKFEVPDNAVGIIIRVGGTSNTASYFASGDYFSLKYLKLEEGDYPTAWTGAPEDDVMVVRNSSMTLTEDALDVSFNNITVMELTETQANFNVKTMSVSGSIVGDVVNTQDGGISYTVDNKNAVIKDLQTWIDQLGKYLTGTVTINIKDALAGDIVLQGFKSQNHYSKIVINFVHEVSGGYTYDGYLDGRIIIHDCDYVEIYGKNDPDYQDINPTTANLGVACYGVGYIYMQDLFVNLADTDYVGTTVGFRFDRATNWYCSNCRVAAGNYGWYSVYDSIGGVHNCKGGANSGDYAFTSGAVSVRFGSVVHVSGTTRPKGSCSVYQSTATISVDSGATATVAVADGDVLPYITCPVTVTVTPKPSTNGTYGGTLISKSSDPGNTVAANMVSYTANNNGIIRNGNLNGGYNYGIWYFGSGSSNRIKSITNLSTATSATLTITRSKQEGGNDYKSFNVYYYTTGIDNGQSSGETPGGYFKTGSTMNTVAMNVSAELGKSVQIALTGSVLTALKNGTIAGFGVSSEYTKQFEPQGCELTLLWQ